jgi:protein-tyrosine-phosphatase
VLSGIGTALIIGCTTLAYTFHGVSILLALLLMRGGVLVIAPLVDVAFRRRVRWFSWTALALSLTAVFIALRDVGSYHLSLTPLAVLGCYLSGYLLRLPCMTHAAKVKDAGHTRRYFVEEAVVALIALTAIPVVLALIGRGAFMLELRRGWSGMLTSPALIPALAIGALYAVLYVFGTLIYLDCRENTFCIPLNRASSLLAGIVAAVVLRSLAGFLPIPASQLAAAVIIGLALVLLSPLHHAFGYAREVAPARKVFLFVCSGNTCRSPLAEAIARAELTERFGSGAPAEALSAGLTAKSGAPMTDRSREALRVLSIEPHLHAARVVTPAIVDSASFIYCMTSGQCDTLIRTAPAAAAKTRCLDPEGDVADPSEQPLAVYVDTARRIQRLVRYRFDEAGLRA